MATKARYAFGSANGCGPQRDCKEAEQYQPPSPLSSHCNALSVFKNLCCGDLSGLAVMCM
jgi:hypothetical protein